MIACQRIFEEWQHVVPLQHRGVLKLVDEKMAEFFTDALVDKRYRLALHDGSNALIKFGNMYDVLVVTKILHHFLDLVQQRHFINMMEDELIQLVMRQLILNGCSGYMKQSIQIGL